MPASEITADALSASGRTSEKLSLPTLQSKMKCDPEGYETELSLIYSQFKSSVELFQQQAALNFTSAASGGVGSDPTVAKDLGDRAMFLAHVTPFYPNQLLGYPKELVEFLRTSARVLPSSLRVTVTQALILLLNRKIVAIKETLALFMELQVLSDKVLKELAFSHVIHSIRRMNQKHKNETENRALQSILFSMLQEEDEKKAMRSLVTICDLHRRKVWFDDRTANAICRACFHSSSRIMIAALSFLLDYEKIEQDSDSDASSDEDEAVHQPHVVVSKEAIYKAKNTGTTSSKKKKKAKLQRVIRSMKKQQRISSERDNNSNYYSPLNSLKDAQGFAEKLFSRLQTCGERFEIKMMIVKVVARTVGLHRLILLNFYPFLQKYVQPHQRDVTNLLAAAVQACHDMVPPDAVEPLFKQIVNQFVHDRSRTESIAVGLNVVREICLRIPLLMTEDLLQDLVLYKKSHEKAVSSAARSLISLFREICPSLLIKKDRGRPTDPKAKPKAFGEVTVPNDVPGADLLRDEEEDDDDDDGSDGSDQDEDNSGIGEEDAISDDDISTHDGGSEFNSDDAAQMESEEDESSEDEGDDDSCSDNDNEEVKDIDGMSIDSQGTRGQKRKFVDFDGELDAASQSLRALKRLAGPKLETDASDSTDGILSNEDFQRIKELKTKKDAKLALAHHGLLKKASDPKSTVFKIPTSDQLSLKRVDGVTLEANIRKKMTKEERKALIKAGREDTGKYQARAAIKQNKTGGLSNRQKEHKKAMPLAAKRSKVERSRRQKKIKQKTAGKQFRGRKAWK
ncbi:protein SDA1 homolog isoform X1 [Cynara cardunculus var. scolymus]|uniref:protein SDA1 homolog isoform X1 n=1 Tax=Cynara cardunculus var. scolymus TaxID=59895 RepID=UPI000D62DD7A|nr:protein SDA1 homolog isoform X1 [Cynara cardunculus var. scolymus]